MKHSYLDSTADYQKMDFDDFVENYEIALISFLGRERMKISSNNFHKSSNLSDVEDSNLQSNNIDIKKFEKQFLINLLGYLNKRFHIMKKYFNHCKETGKYKDWFMQMAVEISEHNMKMQYVEYKLSKLTDIVELERHYHDTKKHQITKNLLLDGKKLNLTERFLIADKILNIGKNIRILNVPDGKKYEFLGFLLNCEISNARNIMNGKYPSNVRTEIIENYVRSFIK